MYIKITTWRYVGYAHPRPQHQRIPDGRDALASALVPRNRSTPEAVVVKEIAFLPRFRRWEAEGGGSRGSLRLILFVVVERLKHVVVLYYHAGDTMASSAPLPWERIRFLFCRQGRRWVLFELRKELAFHAVLLTEPLRFLVGVEESPQVLGKSPWPCPHVRDEGLGEGDSPPCPRDFIEDGVVVAHVRVYVGIYQFRRGTQ